MSSVFLGAIPKTLGDRQREHRVRETDRQTDKDRDRQRERL